MARPRDGLGKAVLGSRVTDAARASVSACCAYKTIGVEQLREAQLYGPVTHYVRNVTRNLKGLADGYILRSKRQKLGSSGRCL